jgi:predicted transcriptional regulator
MTIEELKNRKTALGLTNEMIAKAADLPLSTVQKIMSGAKGTQKIYFGCDRDHSHCRRTAKNEHERREVIPGLRFYL